MQLRHKFEEPIARTCGAVQLLSAERLQLYGYAVVMVYVAFLVCVFRAGTWIVDAQGVPIYTDFACAWIATMQALQGHAAALYDPARFVETQAAFVGPRADLYPNWPYPPPFLLFMAPFAMLRYLYAFLSWDLLTLLGCLSVVYAITRRLPAIALVLAFPLTAWNFLAAQNGFLTASLLGASLLFLERRPMLAGVFIGCLTYKPQFGLLFPVALIAARQWPVMVTATVTAAVLASASLAGLGSEAWGAFPHELLAQANLNLAADPDSNWGYLQSVYGLVRALRGSAGLAWLAQAAITSASAIVVWKVWRSPVRFGLKAAALSAAALISTPYAFAYDMAAIVIPAAFLVRDQIEHGALKGETGQICALFAAALALLAVFGDRPGGVTFGSTPAGIFIALALSGIILRRIAHDPGGRRSLGAISGR
jgi:glycosyl transferase family 87